MDLQGRGILGLKTPFLGSWFLSHFRQHGIRSKSKTMMFTWCKKDENPRTQLLPPGINWTNCNSTILQRMHNGGSFLGLFKSARVTGRDVLWGPTSELNRHYTGNICTLAEHSKWRRFWQKRQARRCYDDLLPVFDGFRCWRSMILFNSLLSSRSERFSGLLLMHPATGHLQSHTEWTSDDVVN